jgi:hypothetical protein
MIVSRDKRTRPREGFALPVALGSMVVIGMILAGVFFAATQENRVGRNTVNQERAFRAAEFGLNNTYSSWPNGTMNALAVGGVSTIVHDSSAKGWIDTVRVTRLNNNSYWLVSTAYAGSGLAQARHRSTTAIRIAFPQINFLAALTVHGGIKIGGSSLTTGMDTPPAGWACPPAGAEQPGIATDNVNNIETSGCNNLNCIIGSPQIQQNAAVSDSNTFFTYGPDANWSTLTAAANINYVGSWNVNGVAPAFTAAGACNTAVASNWGDPNRATPAGTCEGYFPIIYFSGAGSTVHITGGTGQGILLVDGDLIVDGGFQWYGPVIARGHVTTQGTGGHFNGGVMAADVDLEQNTVLGNAIIDYSKCAIDAALVGAGIPKRLKQRSWADMF